MLNTIDEALIDLRAGKCVIVVDDENREAEGDFVCAAEFATPEMINFMATHGRGLICTSITASRVAELHLQMMVHNNASTYETPFTVSVEAKEGTTTGISAADRSLTSCRLADSKFGATDFVTPGHTFPLRARDGGVLARAGHTEAAVDLARMSGLTPAGVICEIMNEDGTMARMEQLKVVAKELDVKLISIEDLIAYRSQREKLVERLELSDITTQWGVFKAYQFRDKISGEDHLALVKGDIKKEIPTLVRVHVSTIMGDVFHAERAFSKNTLSLAMEKIAEENGVLVYLSQNANIAQELGIKESPDEIEVRPAQQSYGMGMQILADLGVGKMKIISSNPTKITGLKGQGLEIVESVALDS